MRMIRDQRGVAMVTVLFIGAVLTITASAAAFISVQELRAGHEDRRAGRVLAIAESGIDRTMQWIRSYEKPWKEITMAGSGANCLYPANVLTGNDGHGGTYTATIEPLQDPDDLDVDDCPAATPPPNEPYPMKIDVRGELPTAVRNVRQVIELVPSGLPIGLYAQTLNANGNGIFQNISVIVESTVTRRDKMDFSGTDPYYDKSDFYTCVPTCEPEGDMPASVHSADRIYGTSGHLEHPPSPNCTGDKVGLDSTWDGSSLGTAVSGGCTDSSGQAPPTSLFTSDDVARIAPRTGLSAEDEALYRGIAQSGGLYCDMTVSPTTCTKTESTGVTTYTNTNTIVAGMVSGLGNYFVVYVDYPSGTDPFANSMRWNANLPVCSTTSTNNQMAIVIVQHGGLELAGGSQLSGAVFAEEGRVDAFGSYTLEGTVVAKEIRASGTPTYKLSQCWIDNLPPPNFNVNAGRWFELDQ